MIIANEGGLSSLMYCWSPAQSRLDQTPWICDPGTSRVTRRNLDTLANPGFFSCPGKSIFRHSENLPRKQLPRKQEDANSQKMQIFSGTFSIKVTPEES